MGGNLLLHLLLHLLGLTVQSQGVVFQQAPLHLDIRDVTKTVDQARRDDPAIGTIFLSQAVVPLVGLVGLVEGLSLPLYLEVHVAVVGDVACGDGIVNQLSILVEDGLADGKREQPQQQTGDMLLWKIVFCKEDKNKANTVVASAPTFDKCVEKFKKRLPGNTVLSITMLDSII